MLNLALQDKILAVFTFLGVFDDVRHRVIEESSGQSLDSMYHPEFLFESVVIPCFNIGQVLAKANPIVPSPFNKKTGRGSWRGSDETEED